MVYRLLGGVSLAIGAFFALITLLVLLPFLNNFNTSLLVLAAIFAVFSWVFLGIGWQLLHPPKRKRPTVAQEDGEGDVERLEEAISSPVRPPSPEGASSPETKEGREHHLRAPRTF